MLTQEELDKIEYCIQCRRQIATHSVEFNKIPEFACKKCAERAKLEGLYVKDGTLLAKIFML